MSKKKLLITGSNGFVAGSIMAQATANYEVHGIARAEMKSNHSSVTHHACDLTDATTFEKIFHSIQPDAVIHAAALANIDFCQNNQDAAKKVNVEVTRTVAQLCQLSGAKLVFCSTDTVFDGIKGDYVEEDAPNPVNFYAETKVQAEQIVLNASAKNVVARLALVIGLPVSGKGNSFLIDLITKLTKYEKVNYPENEIRTPIDVITLGASLIELSENDFHGIIHLSGNTKINRLHMANYVADTLQFSETTKSLILGTNSNAIAGRAKRPNDASMINGKAKKVLRTPMLSLEEGLALTLNKKFEN
ncbi:MAG TPA: NAD(P)-dependent oxidoreductase [Puia sp.]|nr:NAD(P)-dependent oxidoreductase [Puia sp.]